MPLSPSGLIGMGFAIRNMRSHTKFQLIWTINTTLNRGGASQRAPLVIGLNKTFEIELKIVLVTLYQLNTLKRLVLGAEQLNQWRGTGRQIFKTLEVGWVVFMSWSSGQLQRTQPRLL